MFTRTEHPSLHWFAKTTVGQQLWGGILILQYFLWNRNVPVKCSSYACLIIIVCCSVSRNDKHCAQKIYLREIVKDPYRCDWKIPFLSSKHLKCIPSLILVLYFSSSCFLYFLRLKKNKLECCFFIFLFFGQYENLINLRHFILVIVISLGYLILIHPFKQGQDYKIWMCWLISLILTWRLRTNHCCFDDEYDSQARLPLIEPFGHFSLGQKFIYSTIYQMVIGIILLTFPIWHCCICIKENLCRILSSHFLK